MQKEMINKQVIVGQLEKQEELEVEEVAEGAQAEKVEEHDDTTTEEEQSSGPP